jgi:hypothetical protein
MYNLIADHIIVPTYLVGDLLSRIDPIFLINNPDTLTSYLKS